MDFKAALQAEIEAKKRQFDKITATQNSNSADSGANVKAKSVKVADLERQKQEEYLEKQRVLDEHRQVQGKVNIIVIFIYVYTTICTSVTIQFNSIQFNSILKLEKIRRPIIQNQEINRHCPHRVDQCDYEQ